MTGIDTTGGVRVPAAFCGWFAKDPSIQRQVGHVLLRIPEENRRAPRHIIVADDCFQLSCIPVRRVAEVVIKLAEEIFGRQVLEHKNLESFLDSEVPSLKQFHNSNSSSNLKSSSIVVLVNAMLFLQR
ncbi:hypothetical protein IFM89_014932 [Coptis chinensis]|uniref:Uncharacterized protein n=1 Tax=Coptis chinensis TaxID=261450 RepID=A0A835H627_9MAGN|nr:hypothetical protein IFM89_014932 [Coptis chinensis]